MTRRELPIVLALALLLAAIAALGALASRHAPTGWIEYGKPVMTRMAPRP